MQKGKILDPYNPVNWASPINRGLISWWYVDNRSFGSRKLYDLCKKRNGSLNNNLYKSYTKKGIGSILLSSTDSMSATAPFANVSQSEFSVAFWIYPYNSPEAFRTIFSLHNGGHSISRTSSNSIYYGILTNGGGFSSVAVTNSSIPDNQWTFVVVCYDNANGKIYVNGRLGSTSSNISGNIWCNQLMIGNTSNGFTGYITDIALYNKRLNSAEVSSRYFASLNNYVNELNWITPRTRYYLPPTPFAPKLQFLGRKIYGLTR